MYYYFDCEPCRLRFEKEGNYHNPPTRFNCPECGGLVDRVFGANVFVFKPFVDPHLSDKPIEFGSRRERDQYLKSNNLTYDSTDWVRRKAPLSSDQISVEEVMNVYKNTDPRKLKEELYTGSTDGSADIGSA